jgi:hypothetical protein
MPTLIFFKLFAPLHLPGIQAEAHKPALRLPEGLFVAPNPNVEAPVVLHPKPELVPNPGRRVIEKYTMVHKTQVKGYSQVKLKITKGLTNTTDLLMKSVTSLY